jgi:hypothetical protein
MLIATIFAAAMASISAFDAHPDEIHHAHAADYYRTHWLPPKYGEPDAIPSYSSYGTSYLHERDVVYLLAGKWSLVVAPIVGDIHLSYRLFNVALFAAITGAFAWKREARPLLVPLTLSAQVWYVFSYFNADAFAVAVAQFAAYQVAARDSAFNSAIGRGSDGGWWRGALQLGLAIGLLLLAKRNFYVFLAFLAAYLAWREVGLRAALGMALATLVGLGWYYRVPTGAPPWLFACAALVAISLVLLDCWRRAPDSAFRRRIGVLVTAGAIGLALFVPRAAYDKYVVENPSNAISSAVATAEKFAADGFKPSQIAQGLADPELALRARGTSYVTMLTGGNRWLWTSFESLVGAYGYMKIFSSDRFYLLVGGVYVTLVASLVYGVSRTGEATARRSLALAGIFAVLVVLLSSLHSWNSDLQPQGRYFFPALVMLGIAIHDMRGKYPVVAPITAGLAFALGAYSFWDAGLGYIERR